MSQVIVFGSLHYDIIVHGPGRPRKGETVTGERWLPKCGGKGGNQAISAAKAGVSTAMIGAVADDDFGHVLVANQASGHVDIRFIRIVEGLGSGMSVAIFDQDGDYGAVIVSGSNLALGQVDVDAAVELFSRGGVLVLQNEIPDAANVAAARATRSAGGRVVLNAAPARDLSAELMALVDVLVVNQIEAEQLTRVGRRHARRRVGCCAARLNLSCCRGDGRGWWPVSPAMAELAVPAIKVKLVSTHGAGDDLPRARCRTCQRQ
jgi:ribokinase